MHLRTVFQKVRDVYSYDCGRAGFQRARRKPTNKPTLIQTFKDSLKTRPTARPIRSLGTLGGVLRVLRVRGGFRTN